jgi:hypothetical protein
VRQPELPIWNDKHTRLIEKLRQELTDENRDLGDATLACALATNGFPVGSDFDVIYVIRTDGVILSWGLDDSMVREIHDPDWKLYALTQASKHYPELSTLLPTRPAEALSCNACEGTGTLRGWLSCKPCSGLGWFVN